MPSDEHSASLTRLSPVSHSHFTFRPLTRFSTQIVPVNYNLLTVNAFMAATGLYQLSRKWQAPGGLLGERGAGGSSEKEKAAQ